MPQSIKLLATDMDGTLLNSASALTQRTISALTRAARDAYIVLASGRMARSMLPTASALPINAPIIAFNGARVIDLKTGEVLYQRPIDWADAREALRLAEEMDLYIQTYIDDDYYFARETEASVAYGQGIGVMGIEAGKPLSQIESSQILKMLIIEAPERIERARPEIERRLGGRFSIVASKPHFLELTHVQADKGAALEFLAGHLGVRREEVLAFGDAQNDLSMLRYAGIGCAMGNSRPEIKQSADQVALSNDEDGLADWIERHWEGRS